MAATIAVWKEGTCSENHAFAQGHTQHAQSPSSVSFPLSFFTSLRFSLSLSLLANRQMTNLLNSHMEARTVV